MPLLLGTMYTREQIHTESGGGDLQSYLPHAGGDVLCGCFDPNFNKCAPYEIDLGAGPDVVRYARRLLEQESPVPVFLKRDSLAWEYVGRFRAVRYSVDANDLYPAKGIRRKDAVAVLFLEIEAEASNDGTTEDPSISAAKAIEGGVALATHLRRERSRQLTEAKRRAYRAEHGQLSCQACGLTETDLPPEIGEGCFEVHHTQPLGQREGAVVTTLDDLALLSANCHRLIHRSSPMLTLRELTKLRARAA